ncbi:MAG: hypothetical protein GEU88_16845 [Solirubrobacterales bacterium]|nr:hypothetical protein [Solirubrobacterales bacterium]
MRWWTRSDWKRLSGMDRAAELERGRQSYALGAWADAYERLSRADGEAALEARDLELLWEGSVTGGVLGDFAERLSQHGCEVQAVQLRYG